MDRSELTWHVPKRVLLIQHYGRITPEILSEVNVEMDAHLDEGKAPVHVISDSTSMDSFPTNVNQVRQLLRTLNDDRWGWIIAVGTNSTLRFLAVMLSSIFGFRVKTASTLEEATQILRRVDLSIDDGNDSAAGSDVASEPAPSNNAAENS